MNGALYKYEMKSSMKLLIIFAAIMTMYVSIIIGMYDPKMMNMLDEFAKAMPEIMAAVGMNISTTSLLGFMVSYLYGFILIVFPMVFCIVRGNGLIAKYVDKGSMVSLMAAPMKRSKIVITQMMVLISGVVLLIGYVTILEYCVAQSYFPNEIGKSELWKLNIGLLCLHLCIASIIFLASCVCSDTKYSVGFGAGIPAVMYIMKMLANVGGKAENAKYFTMFTLFDPEGIISGKEGAMIGSSILLIVAIIMFGLSVYIFDRKDLSI